MTTALNEAFQKPNDTAIEASLKPEYSQKRRTAEEISTNIHDSTSDMQMSTKQCISCNREMPISSESCICGHVLSDIKSLEGKRYSGYREELYSRLEIKRILGDHEKPKRPRLKQKSPPKQDISNSLHKPQMRRRHKRKSPGPPQLASSATHHENYKVKGNTEQSFEDNPDLWYLNPRYNFTDALADINKRLTSQTSFWISL